MAEPTPPNTTPGSHRLYTFVFYDRFLLAAENLAVVWGRNHGYMTAEDVEEVALSWTSSDISNLEDPCDDYKALRDSLFAWIDNLFTESGED